jgi:ABC-2 type transport system permease protein
VRSSPHQLLHQLRLEQKVFWRNRESAIFIFIFPIMLFLLLGSVYSKKILIGGTSYKAADVLLVGMMAYGVANTAFSGLAIGLVVRREAGILKRLRATPLRPPTYLASVLTSTLIVFLLQTAALFAIGRALFGTPLPGHVVSLILALLLGVAAFAGLGLAAASLIRSSEGASAIVTVIVLPMAFLSGSFGSTRPYPAFLRAIGDVLPLKHYLDILRAIYLDGQEIWTKPGAIAVVAAWGVGGIVVAVRYFGWEPRER